MASGTVGDSCDDFDWRTRCRWTENSIVYTRKSRKKNIKINSDAVTTTSTAAADHTTVPTKVSTAVALENNSSVQHRGEEESVCGHNAKENSTPPSSKEAQHMEQPSFLCSPNEKVQTVNGNGTQNDGELMPVPNQVSSSNRVASFSGIVKPLGLSIVDDRVRFKLVKATAKEEIKELVEKLNLELEQVRRIAMQLDAKEVQVASYNTQISNIVLSNSSNFGIEGRNNGGNSYPQPQVAQLDLVDRRVMVKGSSAIGAVGQQRIRPTGLARVNSDVAATRNLLPRPFSRQLSVAIIEHNQNAELFEKGKRTPKANQYYKNSEFLLGKDRLPPDSGKRQKTVSGRKHSGETEHGLRFDKHRNKVFKSCSSLLQRLMKHKYGWVFNKPVDAELLGLVDYHSVIKHPMDLGTIKTRLLKNWYSAPRDFAEDVRLVFRNAMTYNPKGQDVHVMADQLSQIFEEKWAIIETQSTPYWKYHMHQDTRLPTPTSRKAPSQSHDHGLVPAAPIRLYAPSSLPLRTSDRKPVPKKPKAKDPDKRDMTYDEKQRLSKNLQCLPSEKFDAIIQIIKKRDTALSQHDDEIEVDIDNVDTETLWELDRFVTNYRKSLSKNKRRTELALQARSISNQTVAVMNTTIGIAEEQVGSGTALEGSTAPPTLQSEKKGSNGSGSSSSSSSSTGSGSSSSADSDSDSSSSDRSDAGHSQGT